MRNLVLKAAVISTLGFASANAMATGLINIPATGISVSGGSSAYANCNDTGNFGSCIRWRHHGSL